MNATIRFAAEKDIDALVQFWNENADWDNIDRTEWERRFYRTPLGPAYVVVSESAENGNLEAQFIFFPTRVSVQGTELNACRPYAPIVHRDIRDRLGLLTLMDYVFRMYQFATEEFRQMDIAFLHMLPDPRWVRAFQFFPGVQSGSFPLWSIPCSKYQGSMLEPNYTVQDLDTADERIDLLWAKSEGLYQGSVVRKSHLLPWKLSHGDYRLKGVVEGEKLIGIWASLHKQKDKQWLICDMVAASQTAMDIVLRAACNEAKACFDLFSDVEKQGLQKIAILATPLIQQSIIPLGFTKDQYDFPMVLHVLSDEWKQKGIEPALWYASAND